MVMRFSSRNETKSTLNRSFMYLTCFTTYSALCQRMFRSLLNTTSPPSTCWVSVYFMSPVSPR